MYTYIDDVTKKIMLRKCYGLGVNFFRVISYLHIIRIRVNVERALSVVYSHHTR